MIVSFTFITMHFVEILIDKITNQPSQVEWNSRLLWWCIFPRSHTPGWLCPRPCGWSVWLSLAWLLQSWLVPTSVPPKPLGRVCVSLCGWLAQKFPVLLRHPVVVARLVGLVNPCCCNSSTDPLSGEEVEIFFLSFFSNHNFSLG